MIDEIIEVKQLLNSNEIKEKGIYRKLYLLAKWYSLQEYSYLEIKDLLNKWCQDKHILCKYNLNDIILQAAQDKIKLRENVTVKISEEDVKEIKRRFDTKNTKLLALALLCYAKACADKDKTFSVSLSAVAQWTGINYSRIISNYFPQLVKFEYIEKNKSISHYSWDSKNKHPYSKTNLKFLCNTANNGKYELKENNINELYSVIFE